MDRIIPRILALAILATLGTIGMFGCSDDDNGTNPPPGLDPPENLAAVNGDGEIDLTWDASPSEDRDDFRRYNVYRDTTSLVGVDPSQLEPKRVGTVNSGQERHLNTGATNGTLYYYHVRAELDDGSLSDPSNEVTAAARLERSDITITEFADPNEPSGYDLSAGLPVSLNASNPNRFEATDFYLGTMAEDDSSAADLSLKSPDLLGGEYHHTNIKLLGIGDDKWALTTTPDNGWTDQVAIVEDAVYAIKTSTGNWSKLQVTSLGGDPGSRTITFRYTYQPNASIHQF
ncbi:MAG: hypothetical protein QUU85_10400 [Candidatus Eisenbacteria bacterium]|nr:hypothetical protein [Candidatus Eisenbacteria bacterium]